MQAGAVFAAVHRPADFQKMLEEQVAQHPDNRAAVEWLINLYAGQPLGRGDSHPDAARAAVAS